MEKTIIEKSITITNHYEIKLMGDTKEHFLDGLHVGIYSVVRGGFGSKECQKMMDNTDGYMLVSVTDLDHVEPNGYNEMGVASIMRERDTGDLCAFLHDWSGYDEHVARPILHDNKWEWGETFKNIIKEFIA